ncbi:MAG: long-chain fatty acid--CoA ligase [Deltaproteobacteria bacterium]|jgi:long-chain acyl-CoA synthetase|nr:long-chain fatty acid--CoA ligase [SAR324 cluster bacterium]PQM54929.1 MAG: long-chain fatty acid--CoA ligase [Deltaproteobacteria bacterium]RZO47291.1 MAG: long-chain fatty acid--CoA ligase [Pseudomonadota bacterium]MEC9068755.1 long-chain fatty acid--CoA ligase [SAR324 cluster bacterium]MEC9360990.1 long-chain fatty acid--CoA ligase [SAR324 cluster bacterium]|tara:strand:+ start:88 stop:1878 length:1791 start_codon:yes stop_codon:yes gene_type:complete
MNNTTANGSHKNLIEMLENSRQLYGDRPLYGTKRDGIYEWTTYEQFSEKVDALRGGLASLGVSSGDKVAIICKNTEEWAVSAYATYGLCGQHIPMYETQMPSEWEYIIRDCGAKVLLAANSSIFEKTRNFPDQIDSLEHVILLTGSVEGEVTTYEDLLKKGREKPVQKMEPESHAPMGMIYTSGTTGNPKGVILSHRNLIFECSVVIPLLGMSRDVRTLAFLPWAHVFGQVAEVHGIIGCGGSAGLVDDVNTLVDELGVVKPSVFFAVPRVYNRIYDRLQEQMKEKPGLIRALFYGGLKQAKREREGETLGFLDNLILLLARKIIFKKILNRFGGNLRIAVSGASALSPSVAEFINDIGISIYEGYGLSENTAALSLNYPGSRRFGSVGKPLPGVRIEIDKTVEGSKEEDGEVQAFGENIMIGYHNLPDKTKESITEDGGLRTGDLGHLDSDGYLYITGRVKEQYKLENGKYVAPAPLEESLKLSSYIDQVMLYGFNRPHNVALIVVAMPAVTQYAEDLGISGSTEDILNEPRIRELFKEQLKHFGKDFKGFEHPQNFSLLSEEWGIDNGLLTPTLKLKREVVEEKFKTEIEELFS